MLPFEIYLHEKQNRSMHTVVWQMPRQISDKATTEHLKLNTNEHFNLFRSYSQWLRNAAGS